MPVFSSRPLETGPSDPELAAAGIPDTSPTWELELLISGAVLFALFQIPPVLNSFFAHIEPHATTTMLSAILLVQIYVKAIVNALMGGKSAAPVFLALAPLTALVPVAPSVIDRRFGNRLGPKSRRILTRMVIFAYRSTAQGIMSPIFVPLLTNVGRKKILAIFY